MKLTFNFFHSDHHFLVQCNKSTSFVQDSFLRSLSSWCSRARPIDRFIISFDKKFDKKRRREEGNSRIVRQALELIIALRKLDKPLARTNF